MQVLSHQQAIAGGQQVDVRIRNVVSEIDETLPQHHVLDPWDRLGDGLGLRDVHQPHVGRGERASQ